MEWSFLFFFNSALLGVGLAMDAFSVSMANGLHDPQMSRRRGVQIAGTFAIFQAVMPMTGWVCVHTIVELFSSFEKFIPWIALALLGYIGGKMLVEGIKGYDGKTISQYVKANFNQGRLDFYNENPDRKRDASQRNVVAETQRQEQGSRKSKGASIA